MQNISFSIVISDQILESVYMIRASIGNINICMQRLGSFRSGQVTVQLNMPLGPL